MEKTEVTFEVFEDFEEIKRKLVKNGFNLTETYILNDYYFSKYTLKRLKKMSYRAKRKNISLSTRQKRLTRRALLQAKKKLMRS